MINLDDEARVLLDLARDAHDPSDDDRARVRAALASRLGAAAGLGLAAGVTAAGLGSAAKIAAATSAGATALGTGTAAVKLIGAVVLVCATLGGGAAVIHHVRSASVTPLAASERTAPRCRPGASAAPTAMPPETSESSPEDDGPKADPPTPDLRPTVAVEPQAAQQARTSAIRRSARSAEAPSEAKAGLAERSAGRPIPGVANEARLIHGGVVALKSGQAARALALFDAHALLYPHGVLAEERDAERALALADLGRAADAHTAIEQFLQAYPASPLAVRLRDRQRSLDPAHP
jgi:hypothetical protein